jgi:hypothetical protein
VIWARGLLKGDTVKRLGGEVVGMKTSSEQLNWGYGAQQRLKQPSRRRLRRSTRMWWRKEDRNDRQGGSWGKKIAEIDEDVVGERRP